jgi:alpha-L-rhamnosidase
MNRRTFLQAASAVLASRVARAQEAPAAQRQRWVELAEALKPRLLETTRTPVGIVQPVADSASFLRWKMDPVAPAAALGDRLLRAGDSVVLDFGAHLTGHFTLAVAGEGRGVDAPARIKFTFAEVPPEAAEPFDPHQGFLSRAWLQDETINLDVLPTVVRLPRRYAFRYVKVEVIATSPNYAVRLGDAKATALTSAQGVPPGLPPGTPELLRRIDEVSIHTLRECMQTVFEDGPKRDRRVWIGDLRLQALVNYATFRNYDLVKRCLYLFAGLPREDGLVSALVAERPSPQRGHEYIIDYAALYGAVVLEYARASKDWEAARELWPVVRRQMEILAGYVGRDGLFAAPKGSWVFIDWSRPLERTAAMHGVYVYALRQALELAQAAGARQEAALYARRIGQMAAAARKAFFDPKRRLFVSGAERQVSWATQAWMVLAGVATGDEGRAALRAVRTLPGAIRPGAPYMYHYFVDALLECGMKDEALELIQSYWGGMVAAGADTFWEVYDPSQPPLSPYGNVLINSYCHAWSCTPAYLLRRPGLVPGTSVAGS